MPDHLCSGPRTLQVVSRQRLMPQKGDLRLGETVPAHSIMVERARHLLGDLGTLMHIFEP